MADMPRADITVDTATVASLAAIARASVPDAPADDPVWLVNGWDCSMWRWGEHLALRVPRREIVVPAVLSEQRWLPILAPAIDRDGVRLSAPIFAGEPTARFPWPWSVVPWIDGASAMAEARSDRTAWAAQLAETIAALHVPADAAAPHNPYRGGPLFERDAGVRANLDALAAVTDGDARMLCRLWEEGVRASPWAGAPVWVHGDLHPGNLVIRDGRLAGVIDFSDLTAGDPAYDLAVAWLAFDEAGREIFTRALAYDAHTWVRSRAWAAAIGAMLIAHSDDSPEYRALGREIVGELRNSNAR
ncbi:MULTISPECIES: aminoglycoside phosphotransferase family protein [unclassified Microbacterium]|uniref:aminoglycoside phosphotransferase family protein n=1 Tax=unclassified Microbacterium TaxID=2609290 RepID=UPI00214B049C|nr:MULTISPECIES: aminoglycoside phosphotransferase family protein [unclassified Microbacterium]MCR2784598.1 aminoglycoside phosphotransferase family protein [Microbacterium sp. zg.B96]MDL5350483.1 aminoglycoside phosphotransferase family protein [Microbacterium sp. zg-YB36]WIM14595.1 aminoglycoside phosphotransferase family protein [Microbacterium sp. zg-B96]